MMRTWLIRALIVLGLGALIIFIARNTYWENITVPAPLRGEAATNPWYASQRLAEALGATAEWRKALGTLDETVDVLILSYWHWGLVDSRREAIETWVENGGRLLVGPSLIEDDAFEAWSGIRWERPLIHDDEETDDVEIENDSPNEADTDPDDGLFDNRFGACGTLSETDNTGTAMSGARKLTLCSLAWGRLATEREILWGLANEDLQIARVAVGKGSVTAFNLSPFGNRYIPVVDHAKLFVGSTQLKVGDHFVFLNETAQPSLVELMWRHGAPVIVLALTALAALLWRGGVRFGPLAAIPDRARRSLAEQIRGTGQFAIRVGDGKALYAATLRALHEDARRHIARYESLSNGDRIAAIAARTGIDSDKLAAEMNFSGPRRPADLAQAIALLETARRKILE